jgi:hypothetical protein
MGTFANVRGPAVRAILPVLALVVPLIPIQGFFAIPLSALAGAAMLLVVWRLRPIARPVEPVTPPAALPG